MVPARVIALLLCVSAGHPAYADHNALLPRPQQSRYGSGSVSLAGAHIVTASSPTADDSFAAEELSKYIEERTGSRPTIGESSANPGPSILLERVGATDQPLALPGNSPGPDSSEAYDLTVSSQDITTRARSSTGIFHGIQTLRQMVEG